MNISIPYENTYSELPADFYTHSIAARVSSPKLIAWNSELAEKLGLNLNFDDHEIRTELTDLFSGNKVHPNSKPIAMVYSGHQFGHFSPRLGDGRALLLGELKDSEGVLNDLQLKGSGRTAYSRSGDGKSPLGPVIREYIVSEAMHRLGVPTTRSLAAVTTGESVRREEALAGGILTRVATSHIRVGTFEYFASQGDLTNLKILLDYSVQRLYPELKDSKNLPLEFFKTVMEKQAHLIAKWMSLGFVHGVMNTDNTSVAGITIDYGPCAFLDETDFSKVFSFIDRQGRYAYGNQPRILLWNLTRLAEALLLLYPDLDRKDAASEFEKTLAEFNDVYETEWKKLMLTKIGLEKTEDPKNLELLTQWLEYMTTHKIDYTLGFRELAKLITAVETPTFVKNENLNLFVKSWSHEVLERHSTAEAAATFLNSVNPLYIPRNHMVEKAIQDAYEADFSTFDEMNEVLKNPFEEREKFSAYCRPPKEAEKVLQTFCGT